MDPDGVSVDPRGVRGATHQRPVPPSASSATHQHPLSLSRSLPLPLLDRPTWVGSQYAISTLYAAGRECGTLFVFDGIPTLSPFSPFPIYTHRPQPIAFMYCLTGGASGSIFVDHGPGFVVRDKDGKNPLIKLVDRVQEATDADGTNYTQFR